MLFAGLYDSATLEGEHFVRCRAREREADVSMPPPGQSEPIWTFTIVTTAASSDYAWLHDRQPVILTSQDALDRWLDTSTQDWDPKLSRLLDPYTSTDSPLEWCVHARAVQNLLTSSNSYAVPQEVGRVGVESPTFIEPVEKRKDGIEALFSRQTATHKASGSTSASPAARGKRKREPSPLETKTATDIVKADPIDVDASSDSDVEILRGPVRVSSTFVFPPTHSFVRLTPRPTG